MKTYLLSLNASDFTKNGNLWTSSGIDLYSNKYYKNFSYTKSTTGLNSLGNYTYTGTEIIDGATPTIEGSYAVTDAGELYLDPNQGSYLIFDTNLNSNNNLIINSDNSATPIFTADSEESYLYRFIDTNSRIDIRTFKGAFSTSLNSIESITFDLNIYESDSPQRSLVTSSNNKI
jgi:hypothetical protein